MAASAPRRRLSRDARRAEIMRAGEEVFSERPFEDVSIDDIAAAAGISKNLLYHYFTGKRELYLSVIADSIDRILEASEPDMSLEPMERLAASLDGHLTYSKAHAKGYIALMRGAGWDDDVLEIMRNMQDHVVNRLLAVMPFPDGPPPEVQLAARGWLGMVDYLTLYWLEHGQDMSQERVRELLVNLFVSTFTTAATVGAQP